MYVIESSTYRTVVNIHSHSDVAGLIVMKALEDRFLVSSFK